MATEMMTVEQILELEALEKAAAGGPWRAGRSDTTSYTGAGIGPYKNVYGPRNEPKLHLGHAIPLEEAQGWGDHCIENAQLIAASRNALPALLAMAKAHLELVSALEHLRESERAVLTEWYRQPGEAEYALCPETILKLATNRGWQSPTAKGGNDEG